MAFLRRAPLWRASLTVLLGGTLLLAAMGGCQPEAAPAAPLRLAIIGFLSPETVERKADPLNRYFGALLERPVAVEGGRDAVMTAVRLKSGELDAALFSPLRYVIAQREVPQLQPMARILIDGNDSYRGVIITRQDAGLDALAKLKGTRVCWTATSSTSGYLYPRAVLRAQGFDPEASFADTIFTGGHKASVQALLDGKCDVAATYADAYLRDRTDIPPQTFRTLTQTEPIPFDPLVVRPGLDEASVSAMREALVGPAAKRVEAPPVLQAKGELSFAVAKLDDYEEVRRILAVELALRPAEQPF